MLNMSVVLIWYAIFISCNCVVTRWQYTFTHKQYTEQHKITTNLEECKPCPVFASFTLPFALQLRKNHGKTSVRVRKTSVTVQYTYYQNTHTLQNPHKHTHYKPPPHTHTHTQTHTHTYKHTQTHTHKHTHTHIQTHTHTHITKPSQTHALQNPHITKPTHTHKHTHTQTHTHITKQYKTTTVQIKTNTVQDIHKWNSRYNQMPEV